jgi:hypothetical protein
MPDEEYRYRTSGSISGGKAKVTRKTRKKKLIVAGISSVNDQVKKKTAALSVKHAQQY